MLESLGIVCVYRDLRQLGVSALSSTAEGDRVLMLLHSDAGTLDLAWAVAHELGHLLFTGDPAKDEELHADAFAAAFLMPGREVLGDPKLGPDVDLADAAATCGCPTVCPGAAPARPTQGHRPTVPRPGPRCPRTIQRRRARLASWHPHTACRRRRPSPTSVSLARAISVRRPSVKPLLADATRRYFVDLTR